MATTPYIKMTACFLQAALVAMCIGAPARAQSSRSEQRTTGSSKSSHDLSSEYQRWLDEDVRWIITPEERAAFIRLSKNEERDRFVEAFWLRRDPTPGTAQNEYKEEHYRRIAYANVHFAQAVPGWETDRGRIYIVYGPPEGIKTDSARSSGDPAKPTQVWHYHSIMGYGRNIDLKFVDVCSCGDYRLEAHQKNLLIPDI
ncbi:MAG TPA: GWxTD domain-containing protein [Terriglobales bacterium]